MRKLAIVESLGRTVNRVGFKLKKHSPEILVVTGIVGAVASAVMACKSNHKNSLISLRKQKRKSMIFMRILKMAPRLKKTARKN